MKKSLILLSMLLITTILFVSCCKNIDIPQIETVSTTLTENIGKSTASTEQTTEHIETTPTTEATTQAEIIAPIETTAATEATTNMEYTTPTETTKEEEPTADIFPKIVDADTIIIDKITETHDYDKVKLWLDSDIDMDSFTKEFGIKYYKSIPLKNSTKISMTKDGVTTEIQVESHYRTIIKTEKCYLIVDFYIGDGEAKGFRPITFSNDDIEETIKNLEIGTTVESVMKIDPNGKYDFAYSSYIVYSKYSYHYFSDGTGVEIKYDDANWEIEKITLFYL